jgi:hypothetical protein
MIAETCRKPWCFFEGRFLGNVIDLGSQNPLEVVWGHGVDALGAGYEVWLGTDQEGYDPRIL